MLPSCSREEKSPRNPTVDTGSKQSAAGPWDRMEGKLPDFEKSDEEIHRLRLIFYTIPGCPECQSVEEMVLRIKPEFFERVKTEVVYINSDRGRKAQEYYDFHHGFVLLSPENTVLWRMPGHQISSHRLKRILNKHLKESRDKEH